MLIFITIISILVITFAVWIINKILPFRVCPICTGVSLTWLWLIAAYFFGYHIDLLIPAILMGGSVVGIAYQIEKRLPLPDTQLLWKTLFIPTGFITVYSFIRGWWEIFFGSIGTLILLFIIFLWYPHLKGKKGKDIKTFPSENQKNQIRGLEKKMEECC